MSLAIMSIRDERLVGPEVTAVLGERVSKGRVVLLVPSFAQGLVAQRHLAREGLSLGVTVSTPRAWAEERWGVWGDGRRLVDDVTREVLAHRVLARAAARPGSGVGDTPGAVAVLADLARAGLPWLVGAAVPDGVTGAEAALVGLVSDYASELEGHGLIEPCSAMVALPRILDGAGASVPPLVLAGFGQMSRAERELVCGLAVRHEVVFAAREGESPALAQVRSLASQLAGLARSAGADVVPGAKGGGAPAPLPSRAPELDSLLGALFRADAGRVAPTGAVRLLLPSGPVAEPEIVAREVRSLADAGARDVVIAVPDPAAAWSELAPRLAARGVTVRAELSVGVAGLEPGRAYLEFVQAVARLSELAKTWPPAVDVPDAPSAGTVRVELGDMSWWPPRDVSDFLLSDISHLESERVRALDARWRGNRLLTPAAVLEQLQSERVVSREVASATRELLRGRLGSAASKLLAPYVQGDGALSPMAPEAAAVLSSVLGVAKSLKELGLTADPGAEGSVSLAELVGQAAEALGRARVTLRLERVAEGAGCSVRIMSLTSAARLAPCSADALVLAGQTSTQASVSAPDDVGSALLAAYGVEPPASAMDAARARFAATVAVPRGRLVVERALFGADGKECHPSVMLTELMACYGIEAGARTEKVAEVLGAGRVSLRSETLVGENVAARGVAPAPRGEETPAPAGVISSAERACVLPPPEGVATRDSRPILSASQIETYLECPYKWFSLRRLRLEDADAGFTGAEMGTFAHRVLEVTRRELLARSVERLRGSRALAEARAAREGAMQETEYRAQVEALEACAQEDPAARFPGSSVTDPGALEEARSILEEEFGAHLSHQYQLVRGRVGYQALVAHDTFQRGLQESLRRDLLTLLDYESGILEGFEPRFFERRFGRRGEEVEYAGVLLTGTIDRIDVDAHGQALVIDYKHKSAAGFAGEYDVFPKEGADPLSLALPRRVQSFIYGQVVRRALPDLKVRGAVYLCTKGAHALSGAVDENVLDNVFGARLPGAARLPRILVPRGASFGREGSSGMEALLDACEELVAARIERMLAGDIEAAPVDAKACDYCPVLNCERRLAK